MGRKVVEDADYISKAHARWNYELNCCERYWCCWFQFGNWPCLGDFRRSFDRFWNRYSTESVSAEESVRFNQPLEGQKTNSPRPYFREIRSPTWRVSVGTEPCKMLKTTPGRCRHGGQMAPWKWAARNPSEKNATPEISN